MSVVRVKINMKQSPLISVIIPSYNHAHFLGRALQSVIDQTYVHWEVIVIDNHSGDHTDEVLASFKDSRIKVLKIYNNGSIAASRNLGIRESFGEWMAFLDSDDFWYPEKLKTIMMVIEDSDVYDVLCNDEVMVDKKTGTNTVLRYGPYENDFYQILLVEGNRLSTSATIIRREFLQRHALAFNETVEYITVEDYGLWLDLARTGARFKFIDNVLGEYLVHESNSSGSLALHLENGERLLHYHTYNIQKFNPSPNVLWAKIETRLQVSKLKQEIIKINLVSALNIAFKLVILYPFEVTAYVLFKFFRFIKRVNKNKLNFS